MLPKLKNQRYLDWVKHQGYQHHELLDYIGLEIYPEDIEIFSIILLPNTIIYQDCVLILPYDFDETSVKNNFDRWYDSTYSKSCAQSMINYTSIRDIFLNTSNDTSNNTLMNIALLIKHNWEHMLKSKYSQRIFTIEIKGEPFEPVITFYEQRR